MQQHSPFLDETPPQHSTKRDYLLGGGCFIFFLLIVLIMALAGTAGASTNPIIRALTATAVATTAPQWATVHVYSGRGAIKTDGITVPDTWKIDYVCKGIDLDGISVDGSLQVYVYGPGDSIQDVAVNTTCTGGKVTLGSAIVQSGGQVYLDINSNTAWTVKVSEQK